MPLPVANAHHRITPKPVEEKRLQPPVKEAAPKKPESKEPEAEKLKNAPKEDKPPPTNDSSLNQTATP